MNIKAILTLLTGMLLAVTTASPVLAADFTVTVTNTTHGLFFTPLLITAHGEDEHLFEAGASASTALRAMAEGGDISGLEAQVGGADDDTASNPAAGLLGPGSTVSVDLNTDTTGNAALSLVAMILPTNDGFVGLDALTIPQESGTHVYYLLAWDAGTEANDERVVGADGGAPGTSGIPADPGGHAGTNGTGVTGNEENAMVHIHRGVLGDGDPTGGASDLDSTAHRWLNPVAKLVIEVH